MTKLYEISVYVLEFINNEDRLFGQKLITLGEKGKPKLYTAAELTEILNSRVGNSFKIRTVPSDEQ